MTTEAYIHDLVQMLWRFDRGMLEFTDPPPDEVATGLSTAILAFGENALPALHAALFTEYGSMHVIDVLASIGHPNSAEPLIEFHKHHRSFITGLAAIQALQNLRTEQAYLYLVELLSRYAQGDTYAFETRHEAVVACEALGEWQDRRAIAPLTSAMGVDDSGYGIVDAARRALETYGL